MLSHVVAMTLLLVEVLYYVCTQDGCLNNLSSNNVIDVEINIIS